MNDKELLELAAKAAGLWNPKDPWNGMLKGTGQYWNPLNDSADSLRLAIKLKLIIQPYYFYDQRRQQPATATQPGWGMIKDIVGQFPTYSESNQEYDPEVATRRAIVRAAAEVGKSAVFPTAKEIRENWL
jgi:hypothetical protein